MIPRIADRGQSFKGAALYYLHDKKAKTKERILWTHTHNLPTNDPDKAFGWMAYTAMNAKQLKRNAGISNVGRKSTGGAVYSYSLAWHPKQEPTQQTMLDSALETLGLLGLDEHEAVFVAHEDTEHPHVHIITNLVHPETGRTAVPSYDRLTLSTWAENLERNDGEILCEQRVLNNEQRRYRAEADRQLKLIKYKEKEAQRKQLIQELYQQSDSGKALQVALEHEGYTLAKGDRRGFVLVDKDGEIYSLARQLKGQRAADLRERLKDLQELPHAKMLAEQRKYFDRDQYETERQQKIVDAAIEENQKQNSPQQPVEPKKAEKKEPSPTELNQEHLGKLDAQLAWEEKRRIALNRLEQEQSGFYTERQTLARIQAIQTQLRGLGLLDGFKRKKLEEDLQNQEQNLANIRQRVQEQKEVLHLKLQEQHPDNVDLTKEQIRQRNLEYIRDKMQRSAHSNTLDNGHGLKR